MQEIYLCFCIFFSFKTSLDWQQVVRSQERKNSYHNVELAYIILICIAVSKMLRRTDKPQSLSYKGSLFLMDSKVQNETLLYK